eukprot:SM001662S02987  [mRNA]  locus=s1662:15:1897:- [translate_table: standard]
MAAARANRPLPHPHLRLGRWLRQTGLASGLETLCGQAFGAGRPARLGVYLQRSLVVSLAATLPMAALWLSAGPVLAGLGQDPAIAGLAGLYARWLVLGAPAVAGLQYLQSQEVTTPLVACAAATLAVHVPLSWAFIYALGLGVQGAALATATSSWLNLLLLVTYVSLSGKSSTSHPPSFLGSPTVRYSVCDKTWAGFTWDAFVGLPAFLRLAVPSATMLCLEFWCFELLLLLAGLLPQPALQASAFAI